MTPTSTPELLPAHSPSDAPSIQPAPTSGRVGDKIKLVVHAKGNPRQVTWQGFLLGKEYPLDLVPDGTVPAGLDPRRFPRMLWDTHGIPPGDYTIRALVDGDPPRTAETVLRLEEPAQVSPTPVQLYRTANPVTPELAFWTRIRKGSEALSFPRYLQFLDFLLCGIGEETPHKAVTTEFKDKLQTRRFLPFNDTDAYRILKVATEAFVMVNCAMATESAAGASFFTEADLNDLRQRVELSGNVDLDFLWNQYLKPADSGSDNVPAIKTLMYLQIVRDKLPELQVKTSFFRNIDAVLPADLPEKCYGILREKLAQPCMLELIWSYWHEEGMLVQSLNALSMRFQNVRHGAQDPLAYLEIDPLRPLNNMLWGYIQDEQHRLTLLRRAYEYDHHYGLTLQGKAIPQLRAADSRSKFLEGFHNLLYLCGIFFKEDDDTTVRADGFPILNALKDVHILLTQGAHNQFGDLPATARQEMLLQQWVLARPEFREFLPTRLMVDYPERWMDRVDAMKHVQGWTDVSILHFHNLAVFGEQVLLSIRFHPWSSINDTHQAANWARFWRSEIQGYTHAYRAATAVDLQAEVVHADQATARALPPSIHLTRRLTQQRRQRVPVTAARPLPVTRL